MIPDYPLLFAIGLAIILRSAAFGLGVGWVLRSAGRYELAPRWMMEGSALVVILFASLPALLVALLIVVSYVGLEGG
jgi:uncharacterized membrane protein SpoIIM required for sporulation